MHAPSSRLARLALVAALLVAPSAALGYGVWIHFILPAEVLRDFKAAVSVPAIRTTMVPGASDEDLMRFRTWFYGRAAAMSDTLVRRAFLKRYPTAASFDAKAFKEFLMINPEAQVLGVDSFAAVYRSRTRADVAMDPTARYAPGQRVSLETALRMGSVYPDLDRRNQDRLFRTPEGRVALTARGDTVPMDPMVLNWGNLTGLSSQAHAHIGLNHEKHSNDPGVLTMTPWNFVLDFGFPGEVESYAEANAQLYTDLSYLAMLGGGPGSQMISAIMGGAAMHYISDVGNAIHTIQAGIKDFYSDATWEYWVGRLKTVFGLFGSTPSRNSIGIDILTNHHTLSENLFQAELREAVRLDSAGRKDSISPVMKAVLEKLRKGDDGFRRVLTSILAVNRQKYWYPEYGRLIAAAVIDSSFEDAATIYRLTRTIAVPSLRKAGVRVDFDTVPEARIWEFIRDRTDPAIRAAVDTFNLYEGLGLGRVNVALIGWWDAYLGTGRTSAANKPKLIDGIVRRVVVNQLTYLANADARREEYLSTHGGLKR